MKKIILFVVALAAIGGGYYYYKVRGATAEPTVMTQPFSRGDVVQSVGATGTLEAVETVDVGTQVSGVVQELYADFNSIVRKGQVIAKLDPQLIQTQIEQQTANVVRAEAELERLKVSLADARQKYERAKQMSARELIPRTELETAEVNVKSAEAQIRSSEAALKQAQAQLNNQKVNLAYTTIKAPIDGIVISRNVDQGQTVAASMNAPTLYILAADLTKMQVIANIDEADVGNMRPGQHVTFRVDAFPTDTFTGTVTQVRLQPAVVQNVVTYSTVISVPNPELKLKPGMTANVNIEIARRPNVLRVPNAATRFRPTPEMFAALKQEMPPELERGRGNFGRGGRGEGMRGQPPTGGAPAAQPGSGQPGGSGERPPSAPAAAGQRATGAAATQAPPAAVRQPTARPEASDAATSRDSAADAPPPTNGSEARGPQSGFAEGRARGESVGGGRGGFDPNMSPEERRKRLEERLASMAPEERERFQARMRDGGFGRGEFGGRTGAFAGRQGGAATGGRGGAPGGGSPARTAGADSPARGRAGAPADQPGGQRRGSSEAQPQDQSRTMSSGATTIDSLFGPLPTTESRATVWQYEDKKLKPIRLRLGITDSTFTEVLNENDVPPDAQVVINMTTGLESRTQASPNPQGNPLMGPQRGGRGGGGGGGGRGRG